MMQTRFDLVVIDSTPSGLMAALAGAREGLKVAVVTEDKHLGGMQASGLGWTNAGQRATVGGLAREYFDRVCAFYIQRYGTGSAQAQSCSDGFHFEPHVAEKIYNDWLAEEGVQCLTNDPVVQVVKTDNRIESVITKSGQRVEGDLFLDASYEGDLMHLAGCSWHAGRESTVTYGESLAGVRFPPSRVGEGDHKLQPYDYRLCLTASPDNRVPFRKPEGYDPAMYAWHAAKMQRTPPQRLHDVLPLNPMPNGKTDSRTGEMIGASWDWPHLNLQERRQVAAMHRRFSAGYLWFLLTDPRVPRKVQEELNEWGHAADEFEDNENWPYHIYVREARRLTGDFIMTQRDVTNERYKPDAIALGSFYLDVHPVDLVPDPDGPASLRAEGGFGNLGVRPYEIPYRSLLPRQEECCNLLVTTCLSASHVAYSTIRMETVFMMLGHAAGVAAAISVKEKIALHEMPVQALQNTLKRHGQKLAAAEFNKIWPVVGSKPAPGVEPA